MLELGKNLHSQVFMHFPRRLCQASQWWTVHNLDLDYMNQ